MIHRELTEKIKQLAGKFPVVSITGPRQSGKTTIVKACFPDYHYVNLEMPDIRAIVEEDPRGFLSNYNNGLIIDEAQYVPEIFSYLQGFTDNSHELGKYVLTGSQSFLLLNNISQSLAGRVAILNLLPLSYHEMINESIKSDGLAELMFKGGYPAIFDREIAPTDYYPSYIQSYLERDLRNIINVNNLATFRKFLSITAGRTGQLLNASSMSNEIGIDMKTVQSWLSVLEASFIIYLVRPYHKNYNKRLVKSPKIFFYDTGLLCSLLGLNKAEELHNYFMKGALFENYVFSEIAKHYLNAGTRPHIYFWRNNTGNEVDCIIEDGIDQKIIEIKSGSTINTDFFKGLEYYRKLSGIKPDNIFLIYGGTENLKRNYARILPWNSINSLF